MLDLEDHLERKPKALSGGQRQRVALGRAIVREPAAFLMDEPLSNLDAALRVQTRAEILTLQKRLATTTIYVTHDQIEAMTMGDRIAVMRDGVLQQIDTPEQVYTRPANTFVATFIGSPAMNLLPAPVLGLGADSLLAGFRPEHIHIGSASNGCVGFQAGVEVVEYLGDEQLAHLRLGEYSLVAKLPVDERLEPGTSAAFSVRARSGVVLRGRDRRGDGPAVLSTRHLPRIATSYITGTTVAADRGRRRAAAGELGVLAGMRRAVVGQTCTSRSSPPHVTWKLPGRSTRW